MTSRTIFVVAKCVNVRDELPRLMGSMYVFGISS